MDRRIKNLPVALLIALTLGSAGCDDSEPGEDLLADVEYNSRSSSGSPPPSDDLQNVEAAVDGRTVRISFTHAGDHCGIMPVAALTASDGVILLNLELVRVERTACLAWVADTDVLATSVALPAGSYDVQARVEYAEGLVQFGRAGKVTVE